MAVDLQQRIATLHKNMSSHLNSMDPTLLSSFLIETNSFLAGSFVVQAVLDVIWDNSDIDIWMPHFNSWKHINRIHALLKVHGFVFDCYECHGNFDSADSKSRSFDTHIINEDYRVMSYHGACQNTTKFVKVIIMPADKSFQEIVVAFDILATQLFYDGSSILYFNHNTLPNIIERRIQFSHECLDHEQIRDWWRTFLRVFIYMQRGFTILHHDLDFVVNILVSQLARFDSEDAVALTQSFSNNSLHKSALLIKASRQPQGIDLTFNLGAYVKVSRIAYNNNRQVQLDSASSFLSIPDNGFNVDGLD